MAFENVTPNVKTDITIRGCNPSYVVTSDGVVPEAEVDRTVRVADPSARRADLILLLIVAIVTVFMGLERLVFSKRYEPGVGTAQVISEPATSPGKPAGKGP